MNNLDTKTRAQIIGCLVEGNSIRSTSRMTGVAFNTVLKLVPAIGHACREYQNEVFRDLKCRRKCRRLRYRVQITSDGHRPYIMAVEDAFGSDVDYAMLNQNLRENSG